MTFIANIHSRKYITLVITTNRGDIAFYCVSPMKIMFLFWTYFYLEVVASQSITLACVITHGLEHILNIKLYITH